jgi:hypothetical protein
MPHELRRLSSLAHRERGDHGSLEWGPRLRRRATTSGDGSVAELQAFDAAVAEYYLRLGRSGYRRE